jgi:hypothetical protein
LAILQCKGTAR